MEVLICSLPVRFSLARFKSLNDVANVLEARVAASDDALALLSDVDAFLQLELNEVKVFVLA